MQMLMWVRKASCTVGRKPKSLGYREGESRSLVWNSRWKGRTEAPGHWTLSSVYWGMSCARHSAYPWSHRRKPK